MNGSNMQWDWNTGLNALWGSGPPFIAGTALAGWSIDYGYLTMGRAQARYIGPEPFIPYWSGRVRYCAEHQGMSAPLRIDATGGGWIPVVEGKATATVPFPETPPFPLQAVSNSRAPNDFYKTQAVTFDLNFIVLGSDASDFSTRWGIQFGVWLNGRTPIP